MTGTLWVLMACAVSLVWALPCSAQPTTVFVYNRATDTFNNNAEGFIWQSLGLLDANGKPGTIQPNGNITGAGGKVLGTATRNAAGNVVSLRSLDGTKEAFNVSGGATTNQAWNRVANNGTLHILKHGANYHENNVTHNGGGLHLDNGQIFDGFTTLGGGGTGTGVRYTDDNGNASGPYGLTSRPGAGIKLKADCCWSANDPDGPGVQTSVTKSGEGVTGVGSTEGNTGIVDAKLEFKVSGPPQAVAKAEAALRDAAKKAGFKNKDGTVDNNNVGQWISSLPFDKQHSTAADTIKDTGATIELKYKTEAATSLRGPPTEVLPFGNANFRYAYLENTTELSAAVLIEPGDLLQRTIFQIIQLGELPAEAPEDTELTSGIFDFRHRGIEPPLGGPLDFELTVVGDPDLIAPFLFDGVGWTQLVDFTVADDTLTVTTERVGILAAFETVPAPSTVWLFATGAAVAGFLVRARVAGRRRRSARSSARSRAVADSRAFSVLSAYFTNRDSSGCKVTNSH
jgi:hypothetical protein